VAKYADRQAAIDAGYKPMEPEGLAIMHYVTARLLHRDADILRPDHVQSLIYFNSTRGPILIGAMYIMPRSGWRAGDRRFAHRLAQARRTSASTGDRRHRASRTTGPPTPTTRAARVREEAATAARRDASRLLIENPDGPFGSDMRRRSWRPSNSQALAVGGAACNLARCVSSGSTPTSRLAARPVHWKFPVLHDFGTLDPAVSDGRDRHGNPAEPVQRLIKVEQQPQHRCGPATSVPQPLTTA